MKTLIRSRRTLFEEKWKITPGWVKGVKAWWKQWVKKSGSISKMRGEKGYKAAIRYLEGGIDNIRKLRDDLWLNKGAWPMHITGNEKGDRKTDMIGRKNLAWDLEHAEEIVEDKVSRLRHWYNSNYNPASLPGGQIGGSKEKKFGKNGDLDALDAEIEAIVESVKGVDLYISGKVFRRLNAFMKKWNALGDQIDPFEKKVDTEFSIGKMKVVFQPVTGGPSRHNVRSLGRHPEQVQEPGMSKLYIKSLDTARQLLTKAGFGKAWYGVTWVVPLGGARSFKGVKSGNVYKEGAHWTWSDDIVIFSDVYVSNVKSIARVIVHEIGHRWYYKFMNKGERSRFDSYFGEVSATTSYGREKSSEDFAEVFSFYVMGMHLTRDQRERFKQFSLKGGKIRRQEGFDEVPSVGVLCPVGAGSANGRGSEKEWCAMSSRIAVLAEELAVFCEAISSSKIHEAKQTLGWHRQDANYLRRIAKGEKPEMSKMTKKAAAMHDAAGDAFEVALKTETMADLRKARKARMDALVFTGERAYAADKFNQKA